MFGMSLGVILPRYTNWLRISVIWWVSKFIPLLFIINWADFTQGVGMAQFFISFAIFDCSRSGIGPPSHHITPRHTTPT